MGFFFNEEKGEAPRAKPKPKQRLQDIPVASLRQLGCSVCPRDKDRLDTPKMAPMGRNGAEVYLLWEQPSAKDDQKGMYLSDAAGRAVESALGRRFVEKQCAVGSVVQCAGDERPSLAETECCRGRAEREIAERRPAVVVAVGDGALQWAIGRTDVTAMQHRGAWFAARIGGHACWVYSVLYPNYANSKQPSSRDDDIRRVVEHDCRELVSAVERGLERPDYRAGPYDAGIEIITGQEPGDIARLEKALQELAGAPRGALDIETNTLRPFMHRRPLIYCAAVGTFERTVAFSLDHPDGWGSEHQRRRARGLFYEYVMASGPKACHNLGFEMEWLAADGGAHALRRTEWDDTMASAYVLDERGGTKSLGMQTHRLFGFDLKAQSRVDPERLLEYPIREALRYNGLDTKWTNAVRDAHRPLIDAVPAFRERYEDLVALAPTLALTTAAGLPVDQEFAAKASERLAGELAEIEGRIAKDPAVREYQRRHGTFSPTNPDHLLQLLKDEGREEIRVFDKKSKQTKESTSEEVLLVIGDQVPACGLVLEHRGVSKLKGTYVDPTASGDNVCHDGLIRSKYNSMHTLTTRLSADDPAVQNWPARKHKWVRAMVGVRLLEKLERVRKWFAAFDYGQIEFRVVGMASEDPNIVRACWTGYDVHKFWAERLMAIYPEVVDWLLEEFDEQLGKQRAKEAKEFDEDKALLKLLRQEMKNKWVFPQLFGSSMRSCAEALHLPEDVTEDLGREFWDEFRVVKKWQQRVLDGYHRNLYVETLGGARRRGLMTPNEAINMPIQGTAAEIVKRAMTALSVEAEMWDEPELQPRFNGHDDLSTILSDDGLEARMDRTARIMCEHRFSFINVPLVVEAKVGPNWADLDEVKVYRSDELFNLRNPYA